MSLRQIIFEHNIATLLCQFPGQCCRCFQFDSVDWCGDGGLTGAQCVLVESHSQVKPARPTATVMRTAYSLTSSAQSRVSLTTPTNSTGPTQLPPPPMPAHVNTPLPLPLTLILTDQT